MKSREVGVGDLPSVDSDIQNVGHDVATETNFFDELIEQVDEESLKYVLDKIMKSRLNDKERECLIARYLGKNKKTLKEIAEEEGVVTQTIFAREEKAKKKIKKFFKVVTDAMDMDPDWDYKKNMTLKQSEDPNADFFRGKKIPQLQQLIDFVRENEDRFFRLSDDKQDID